MTEGTVGNQEVQRFCDAFTLRIFLASKAKIWPKMKMLINITTETDFKDKAANRMQF